MIKLRSSGQILVVKTACAATARENGIEIRNLAPLFRSKLPEPYYVKYAYDPSLQDKPIHETELLARAKEERQRDEKFAVIIRADESVPYRAVIHLLDAFKKAGISRVGLATDKEAGS